MSERDEVAFGEVVDRTRAWVRENFLYMRPDWPLQEDSPLLRSGVIDSIGVIELVGFLERSFHVTIPEDQITEKNLGTLGAIGAFVARAAHRAARSNGVTSPAAD